MKVVAAHGPLLPMACLWLVVAVFVVGIALGNSGENKKEAQNDEDDTAAAIPATDRCRLYFGESTIPGAGWGMFAGVDVERGEQVTPGDAVVPVLDMAWHNNRAEFQDTFLWDEYVWSSTTFPGMAAPGHFLNGASFGIGAAPNCLFSQLNVEDSWIIARDDQHHPQLEAGSDDGAVGVIHPGAGAYTPFYNRTSTATTHVRAGEELFVDYGYGYFEGDREDLYGLIPFVESFARADNLLKKYQVVRNATLQRWRKNRRYEDDAAGKEKSCSNPQDAGECRSTAAADDGGDDSSFPADFPRDLYGVLHDALKPWPIRVFGALPDKSDNVSDVVDHLLDRDGGGTIRRDYNRSLRSRRWLRDSAVCMDHLRPLRVSTVPHAGRGAAAARDLKEGQVVAPVPLIHVPERKILTMYGGYVNVFGAHKRNSSRPVHAQLLLNYCYGHRDSTLLLCPYGVVSSLINHAPTGAATTAATGGAAAANGPTANVKIRWSDTLIRRPEWFELPLKEWAYTYQTGLAFEYVAVRNIKAGEEVLLDYGQEWQDAWDKHLAQWKPKRQRSATLNAVPDLVLPTVEEGWSSLTMKLGNESDGYNEDDNEEELHLWCYDWYRHAQGLPEYDSTAEAYPCRIIAREEVLAEDGTVVDFVYTAEFVKRSYGQETEDGYVPGPKGEQCTEEFDWEVLWAAPRDAFSFGGVYQFRESIEYMQPWSFRHDLRIPDELMPEAWKNLLEKHENESAKDE